MALSEDGGPLTVNVIFHQRKRFLDARSRAGTSRNDKVSGFRGRLYGMTEEAPIR